MPTELYINGIPVTFPLNNPPYPQQKAVMNKIITALNKKQNALLESPTGTGKSLALLCAALAWQQNEKKKLSCGNSNSKLPRIYFASRTHSQLKQLIGELKQTVYRNTKMTVLAGRELLCIKDVVKKSYDIDDACKDMCHEGGCQFYRNLPKQNEDAANQLYETICQGKDDFAFDIEDIVNHLGKAEICPYYASNKLLSKDADLIFCPYNYLIDPFIREKMYIKTENEVVIFDEAHNIEDNCREALSFHLKTSDLAAEKRFFENIRDRQSESSELFKALEVLAMLCAKILQMMFEFEGDAKNWNTPDHELQWKKEFVYNTVFSGNELSDLIEKTLDISSGPNLFEYFRCKERFEEYFEKFSRKKATLATKSSAKCIEKILQFVKCICCDNGNNASDFKLCFTKSLESNAKKSSKKTKNVDIESWDIWMDVYCLNPAVTFKDVGRNAHSVIVASGTLSPINTFQSELGVPFQQILQCSHVVPSNQILVMSISRGPNNRPIDLRQSYFESCKKSEVLDEIGDFLFDLCETAPVGGVLCFLPSYPKLELLHNRWKETNFQYKLDATRELFFENREKETCNELMGLYKEAVDRAIQSVSNPNSTNEEVRSKGAIFVAVYRAKLAEGLNFADEYARVVVCVGIPYPAIFQRDIVYKKEYNTSKKNCDDVGGYRIDGKTWYKIQAFRAVNQALGRCLRHRSDWASIILVDERYENDVEYLPKWVRDILQHANCFGHLVEAIERFGIEMNSQRFDVRAELNNTETTEAAFSETTINDLSSSDDTEDEFSSMKESDFDSDSSSRTKFANKIKTSETESDAVGEATSSESEANMFNENLLSESSSKRESSESYRTTSNSSIQYIESPSNGKKYAQFVNDIDNQLNDCQLSSRQKEKLNKSVQTEE